MTVEAVEPDLSGGPAPVTSWSERRFKNAADRMVTAIESSSFMTALAEVKPVYDVVDYVVELGVKTWNIFQPLRDDARDNDLGPLAADYFGQLEIFLDTWRQPDDDMVAAALETGRTMMPLDVDDFERDFDGLRAKLVEVAEGLASFTGDDDVARRAAALRSKLGLAPEADSADESEELATVVELPVRRAAEQTRAYPEPGVAAAEAPQYTGRGSTFANAVMAYKRNGGERGALPVM